MSEIPVTITSIPITGTIGCAVPVLPGTALVDAPLEERTELCAVDANWLIGAVPTCDIHLKLVCDQVEWNWEELLVEAGRDIASGETPWADRQRHSQAEALAHREAMAG